MLTENILWSNQELLPILLSYIESTNYYTRALGYLVAKALLDKLSGQRQVDVARKLLDGMKLQEISGIDDLPAEPGQFIEVSPISLQLVLVDPLLIESKRGARKTCSSQAD